MNYLEAKTHRKLTFGKYKGEFVHDVCWMNPSYIAWLERNTNFRMNDEEREHYKEVLNNRQQRSYDIHPGCEASCDPWESWAYGGAVSPWGSDFM